MPIVGYTDYGLMVFDLGNGVYEVSATEILKWAVGVREPTLGVIRFSVGVGAHVAIGDEIGYALHSGEYPIVAPLTGEVVAAPFHLPRDPDWSDQDYVNALEEFEHSYSYADHNYLFRLRAEGPPPALRERPPETTEDLA